MSWLGMIALSTMFVTTGAYERKVWQTSTSILHDLFISGDLESVPTMRQPSSGPGNHQLTSRMAEKKIELSVLWISCINLALDRRIITITTMVMMTTMITMKMMKTIILMITNHPTHLWHRIARCWLVRLCFRYCLSLTDTNLSMQGDTPLSPAQRYQADLKKQIAEKSANKVGQPRSWCHLRSMAEPECRTSKTLPEESSNKLRACPSRG